MKNSREEGKLGELRVMNRWWEGVEKKGEAIAGESLQKGTEIRTKVKNLLCDYRWN